MAPSFSDRSDFDDADRGFVAALDPATISGPDGTTVWDGDAYRFLDSECPDTANPSLWRQGRLVAKQGLYQVTDGIYQVRGLDLSNITFVEGRTGVIVIDPLISTETARAALGLYREHRGERAVSAVIYTHSHVDHFGGVRGVVPDGADIPVYAPAGFMEHAVSENVYAGIAMARRSIYMYGAELGKGPAGQIGCGLGMTTSTGTVSLIPPTVDITATGQEEVIDGVRVVFQITPGTEAPSEMNFLFPDHRALCMAENATHNLHNLLTLRGAVVRNPHTWAHYLTEAVSLFGDRADVLFASHHWPTYGQANLVAFLQEQRDLYAYLHDQTLRGVNSGMTGIEIAETMELPPKLEGAWHARGYYGSVSHNVKAIYQHYMGWFDGNPAHLWEHPPVESAKRYVEFMGGADQILRKAEDSFAAGDLRWVAQVVNHVVFAEPDNQSARELLARAYERLGYGAENGPWRNFYLQGAQELRGNLAEQSIDTTGPDMVAALTVDQVFDSLAVRVDGPGCWDERLNIDWTFTDLGQSRRTTLANGVLVTQPVPDRGEPAGLTVALTVPQLLQAVSTGDLDGTRTEGDTGLLRRLLGTLAEPDRSFPIVTP